MKILKMFKQATGTIIDSCWYKLNIQSAGKHHDIQKASKEISFSLPTFSFKEGFKSLINNAVPKTKRRRNGSCQLTNYRDRRDYLKVVGLKNLANGNTR